MKLHPEIENNIVLVGAVVFILIIMIARIALGVTEGTPPTPPPVAAPLGIPDHNTPPP